MPNGALENNSLPAAIQWDLMRRVRPSREFYGWLDDGNKELIPTTDSLRFDFGKRYP